jgi:NAD-dependent dihydropyrimidine dehydrogenase PreA subunit
MKNKLVYTMPIDPDFYKTLLKRDTPHQNQVTGSKHYVWGEGVERELDFTDIKSQDQELIEKHIAEKGYLGIHGTNVAVDFDLCIADGACIKTCPVQVFGWNLKPQEGPTSKGSGNNLNEYDKSDPFSEKSCIYCLACESVCPTTAIKIQEGLKNRIQ